MSNETVLPYKGLKCSGAVVDPNAKKILKKWTFDPLDSITPYELSILLPYLLTSGQPLLLLSDLEFFKTVNLLKYFTIEDISPIVKAAPTFELPPKPKTN